MAKKKKYNTKRKTSTKNTRTDDAARRITHLWAASHLVAGCTPTLSAFYNRTIKQIGRRINLSLDAQSVKRHMCKRCDALLGDARRRLRPHRQSHVVVTCASCGAVRRYVNREKPLLKKRVGRPAAPAPALAPKSAPKPKSEAVHDSQVRMRLDGDQVEPEPQSRVSCVAF